MKPTRRIAKYLVLYSAALLVVACESRMGPAAKNAIDNINATLATVSADAQKYVPDQLTGVQDKVAALTASYDKRDYGAVMASAPAVRTAINDLTGAIAAKKDEILKALGDDWRSLSASVPQSVTAVQTRIDELSKTKRVPKDVDLAAAKSGLADAASEWEKAQSEFKSGNAADAVPLAKDAKAKLDSAAASLKLTLPQAG
ncbi:MAG TPA: hypothetical protein VGI65_17035 [Steroidobacteraceae bacterium]